MIRNLHNKLFHDNTPFANACICALVIGIGDLICTVSDLFWLFGDMSIQIHPHHYIVMAGLITALTVMVASFVWLYIAINRFYTKRMHKQINNRALKNAKRRAAYAQKKAIDNSTKP